MQAIRNYIRILLHATETLRRFTDSGDRLFDCLPF